MQGNGGTVASAIVAEHAVATVMSGPASGVIAAAATALQAGARRASSRNVVTYDMGGTSSDVALVLGRPAAVSSDLELEYAMPIHVPMVDVHTIGAGGGSIASVDAAGMLRVGPESAGALPGPICYGRGGTRPTITDANLVLGRLDPGAAARGRRRRCRWRRSRPRIAGAGRRAARPRRDRGRGRHRARRQRPHGRRDPDGEPGARPRPARLRAVRLRRRRPAARGGAGARARHPEGADPGAAGLTNALGCVVADLRHDFVATVNQPLEALAEGRDRRRLCARRSRPGGRCSRARSVAVESVRTRCTAPTCSSRARATSCRWRSTRPRSRVDELRAAFAAAYWRRFGVELPEIRPVLVNLHTAVIGRRRPVSLRAIAAADAGGDARRGAPDDARRSGSSDGWHETPVYVREHLPRGRALSTARRSSSSSTARP